MRSVSLPIRFILLVLIPLVIVTFAYVQWVNARSHAVANFDPGWRPSDSKTASITIILQTKDNRLKIKTFRQLLLWQMQVYKYLI